MSTQQVPQRAGAGSGSMAGFRPARAVLWAVIAAALLLGLAAGPARAADEVASRFVWDEVSVTVRLQNDGTMRVREHDTVLFTGGPFRQGFREIPLAAIESISQVTLAEVGSGPAQPYSYVSPGAYSRNAPHTYTFQRVGTVVRIEWSFPPTTSAQRAFVIEYLARGALRVSEGVQPPYQEIWWVGVDDTLTQDAPVNRAKLIFVLPRAVDPAATVARSNGTAFGEADGQTWFWRAEHLGAGDSLQASLRFPPLVQASKPAWQDTRDRQISREVSANVAFLGLALLTAVGGSVGLLAAWWLRGRDPVAGPAPEFLTAPPYAAPPGVVGALLDEHVKERDYLATLVDLGRRGVVRISQTVQPELGSRQRMVVTLLQPEAPVAPFERELLLALFADTWWRNAQARLPLDNPAGLGEALQRVDDLLYGELVQRGYFTTRPPRTRAGWRMAGIALWVAAIALWLLGSLITHTMTWVMLACAVLAALGAAVYVVSQHMPQKTLLGAEAAARWQAFRRHMEAIDRVGVGDGGQDGFERYLPYAIAFGIERRWVAAFASAETERPAWYDTVNLDGAWRHAGWRPGAAELPDLELNLPAPGGLQELSSLTASSLQSSSDALFDMFNEVKFSFTPEQVAQAAGASNVSGSDLAVRIGFRLLLSVLSGGRGGRGSGGGGGGFS